MRGHLQEEEGLKSRCIDTWMKMESLELAAQLARNCAASARQLHESEPPQQFILR